MYTYAFGKQNPIYVCFKWTSQVVKSKREACSKIHFLTYERPRPPKKRTSKICSSCRRCWEEVSPEDAPEHYWVITALGPCRMRATVCRLVPVCEVLMKRKWGPRLTFSRGWNTCVSPRKHSPETSHEFLLSAT